MTRSALFLGLTLLFSTLCPGADDGAMLFRNVCAACHGPEGQGNEVLRVPSIAGRPAWYVLRQLGHFREGRRGAHADEPQALIMATMVKTLDPKLLPAVAAHVEKLAMAAPRPTGVLKEPDVALGRELFQERCMECHRFNAMGEVVFGSPPLVGLPDWYLLAQIQKFKNGRRGTSPDDQNGAKMLRSSQFVEDETALHSVVAYIVSLNRQLPKANEDFGAAGLKSASR